MNKLKSTARHLDSFFRFCFWLVVVVVTLGIGISMVLFAFGNNAWMEAAFVSLQIDGVSSVGIEGISLNAFVAVWIIHAVLSGAFVCYGIKIIRHILSPMKNGEPFAKTVSDDLKNLGWFSIAYGIIHITVEVAGKSFIVNAVNGANALASDGAKIDGSFILIALFLFLFSYIFKYGETLQEQSDETL